MRNTSRIARAARRAWWWLRQVTGDAAYENYLGSRARPESRSRPDGPSVVSREQFYLQMLERKYTSASRCC